MEVQKRAFSIIEFAKRWGISRSKVYLEIRAGRLRIAHIGSRSLITVESEDDYRRLIDGEALGVEAEDRRAA